MEFVVIIILLIIMAEVSYLVLKDGVVPIARKTQPNPVFIDTSVLMDGRILSLAASGFIGRTLYVPRSVVGELQYLADNGDHEKRMRARAGLDVINELQQLPRVTVELYQDGSVAKEGVDERLLLLAKKHNGAICTIDFNLNKVATVEDIEVLNINELAQKLRITHLPGERTTLALTQKGQDAHQAIGHLDDGTMVVVEQAAQKVGTAVEVEFIRSLQTAAGKMLFARPVGIDPKAAKTTKTSAKKTTTASAKQPAKGRAPQQKTKPAQQAPKRSRKPVRKDHEASLIELVNKQD